MRIVLTSAFLLVATALLVQSYEQFRHTSSVYYGHSAKGWIKKQRVADAVKVPLVFAIKQQNVDRLEEILLQVSNPNHPAWGKHLTLEQVGEITSDWEATNAVHAWLLSSGVAAQDIAVTVNGDFIRVLIPVRMAEQLLSCEFNYFAHPSRPHVLSARTELYRLPLQVADRVDFVGYTIHSINPQPSRPRHSLSREVIESVRLGQIPPGYCVPNTLFTYYGISNPTVASASATQSVYENLGQSFSPADLASFLSQFNLPNATMSNVIGPNDPNACSQDPNNCVEADLDVEYIMAVAQGSPTTFWSIANGDNEPFLDWIVAVANTTNPPLVHSISYGDIESQDDPTSMQRFNTEAMKLGTRGVSIMVASGDDGVANFIARTDPTQCGFNPSFPATAPYITAVGATQGPENNTAEIACTSQTGGGITTGGGFSTQFNTPSYQTEVVQNYLQNGPNLPPFSMFNKGGRGYPDVAMLGHNYIVVDGGQLSAGSGTSASSPVFAAVITLVNGLRAAAGKTPLGFLNQILYGFASTNPQVFNDITSGENNCCAGDPGNQTCCQYGFTATTGWDPLTGLGSVHFPALSQALLNLP